VHVPHVPYVSVKNVREIVAHAAAEEPRAWALSQPGCRRIVVSAHDTGTYAASEVDPVGAVVSYVLNCQPETHNLEPKPYSPPHVSLLPAPPHLTCAGPVHPASCARYHRAVVQRAVFIVSNSDVTASQPERLPWRSLASMFHTDKDVSAVCSLSFHLPREAVMMRAVTPLGMAESSSATSSVAGDAVGDVAGDVESNVTARATSGATDGGACAGDRRTVMVSFRGNIRGQLRTEVFRHFRELRHPDWDLGDMGGQVTAGQAAPVV